MGIGFATNLAHLKVCLTYHNEEHWNGKDVDSHDAVELTRQSRDLKMYICEVECTRDDRWCRLYQKLVRRKAKSDKMMFHKQGAQDQIRFPRTAEMLHGGAGNCDDRDSAEISPLSQHAGGLQEKEYEDPTVAGNRMILDSSGRRIT